MHILFLDKNYFSSETRGNLLYKKYISNFYDIEIIETSLWYKNIFYKILILKKIIYFYFKNFKVEKNAICLKFTPFFIFFVCKFLKIKIIYDCDDLIWSKNFFGETKTKFLFNLSFLVIFENFFLKKKYLLSFNKIHSNITVINCPLPEFKLKKRNNNMNEAFIPTFIYIGSKYTFEQILPLLKLIDSQNQLWDLIILGGYINKAKYSFLRNLIYKTSYNSQEMCVYLDRANVGLYSKAISDFDKGRGFHKKLIYLSRGLPILSFFSNKKKIVSNSHIALNDCWDENKINIKYKQFINYNIIKIWNANILNKFSTIFKLKKL
jgi:hypothetical protein